MIKLIFKNKKYPIIESEFDISKPLEDNEMLIEAMPKIPTQIKLDTFLC